MSPLCPASRVRFALPSLASSRSPASSLLAAPAREAHGRAHQLRALPVRDAARAASSGTPTASGSPSCAAPGETDEPLRARRDEGRAESLLLDGAKLVTPGEKPRPLPLATALAGCPTARRCSSRPRATSSRSTCAPAPCGRSCRRPRRRSTPRPRPTAARRLRPQERPLRRRRGDRPGDPPHPGRLRHAAQRQARLGLRGGARLALRPGVPLVARLARRSPTCSSTRRACPPSPSSTSCPSATRSSGSATRRPAPRTRSSASASSASTRTARPGPSGSSRSTPDDVYVLPQLGWTPDSRSVAFQHLNRAQNELELRLLPVPGLAARAARHAAHGPHRALEGLGQHLRRRRAS